MGVTVGDIIAFRSQPTALEFFAGIGLARAGMATAGVRTIWANDIDKTKSELYRAQWGNGDLFTGDVHTVDATSVPTADIAWASSPCTDLSLAGKRAGLVGGRESSAFFGFTHVIQGMGNRRPKALVLENVTGLATSHGGDDYRMVVEEFNRLGYSVDSFELDARRWLPQSRPRMFVVGLSHDLCLGQLSGGETEVDSSLRPDRLSWIHSDQTLATHVTPICGCPEPLAGGFHRVVERMEPSDVRWWGEQRMQAFISSLSPAQAKRLNSLVFSDGVSYRTSYRRTRDGVPRWEIRADDIAGCLRTARGGSSRQAVVCAGNGQLAVRWMTGLEYARLQGAGDFKLDGFTDAQVRYAFGDAVAVPAVSWLMDNAVVPYLNAASIRRNTLEAKDVANGA